MYWPEKLQILYHISGATCMALYVWTSCWCPDNFWLNHKTKPLECSIRNSRWIVSGVELLGFIVIHDADRIGIHQCDHLVLRGRHNASLLLHLPPLSNQSWSDN